jgi:uncharacterized protein with PQ loop repeat
MEQSLGLAASVFGVAMACGPLIQIERIWKRKSSDDVSWIFFSIITIGAGLWAAYGLALGDLFLVIPNVIGVATNLFLVGMIFRFRSPDERASDHPGSKRRRRDATGLDADEQLGGPEAEELALVQSQ